MDVVDTGGRTPSPGSLSVLQLFRLDNGDLPRFSSSVDCRDLDLSGTFDGNLRIAGELLTLLLGNLP